MMQIKRGTGIVASVEPQSSSNYSKAVMGEEQITLVWEDAVYIQYNIGDYIVYEGANWTLNKLPGVKKLSSKLWQYNAVFQSTKYELAKVMYLLFDNTGTLPSGEFSLTGNANTFVNLLVENLNRVAGSALWTVGEVTELTDFRNLSFSNEDCLSVIGRLADEWKTEYHILNHVINLKKISTEREIQLEYGANLYDIERTSVDSSDIVTRIYPFGSKLNLKPDYRGGNTNLRIAEHLGTYIEFNTEVYGVIERAITFDEVYPRLSSGSAGNITAVGNQYTFTDSALDFDVNAQLLDGTPGKIHFTTGQCAGYDFEIKSYNHSTKTFVILPNKLENDFELPTADIKPAVNDKYVLIDISMPYYYLNEAENELYVKAEEYILKNSIPKVSYRATFSTIFAKQNLQNVECGDTINILDVDLGISEQIRIIKLQKGITDYWTVQFDLANTVSTSRIERIEGSVNAVQNTVIVSNEKINRNNLKAYQNNKELREMVFDPDGYFDPENIKPLSIETSMISVGAKSQSFQLNSLLQPNYLGNCQVLQWSSGSLVHFTINDDQIKEWTITQGSITISGTNETAALYIYARCAKAGSTGDIYLSTQAYKFDFDASNYYFLIGILHTPANNVRGISLTYGMTTINGRFIKTGVISSINGNSYFDLDNGVFRGDLKFTSGDSVLDAVNNAQGSANTAQTMASNAQGTANTAQTLANNAQGTANTASSNAIYAINQASAANSLLADIASDGKLTPDEKQMVKKEWDVIVSELSKNDTQADSFNVSRVAYDAAYSALNTYITPLLSSLTTTSDITGSTFRANFKSYYDARTDLLNAIALKAKQLADAAQATANSALANAAAAMSAASDAQSAADGAQATANALEYLAEAMQGSTDISGGLLATNVLLMKDAAATPKITAGLSGIADDNVGFWAGGTYAEAIASLAKIILRKDGSGQMAGGNILFDAAGNLTLKGVIKAMAGGKIGGLDITENSLINASIAISNSIVESISELNTPYEVTLMPAITWDDEGVREVHAYSQDLEVDFDCVLKFKVNTGSINATDHWYIYIEDANGLKVHERSGMGDLTNYYVEVNLTAGTYSIHATNMAFDINGQVVNSTIEISGFGQAAIIATGIKARTKIGNDGFYSFWAADKLIHYSEETGLTLKGLFDMPGILATGSVAYSGGTVTHSNKLGPKKSTSNAVRESTGVFTVPHTVGHSNFTVFVNCSLPGFTPWVSYKRTNNIEVAIKNLSDNLADCNFDYLIIGYN